MLGLRVTQADDAANWRNVPSYAGLVCPYVDGAYAWPTSVFPKALKQTITVLGLEPADWVDVEPGCRTVTQAIDLYDRKQAKGFYSDIYDYNIIRAARPAGPFFVANPTGTPHMYDAPNVVATQWAQNVRGLDFSEFDDIYLGLTPTPTPAPGPSPAPGPGPIIVPTESDPDMIVYVTYGTPNTPGAGLGLLFVTGASATRMDLSEPITANPALPQMTMATADWKKIPLVSLTAGP